MADREDAKDLGQELYEQFCRDEYAKPPYACWNRWEMLEPELKADWARSELTGIGNPAEKMRRLSPYGETGDGPR